MIGILDSGLGGLTAARHITDLLTEYDIIYYGDTARSPYDNKSLPLIKQYAQEGMAFLLQHGAEIIVISCHCMAAALTGENFSIPVLDAISPAAALAVKQSRKGQIGIICPRAVAESRVYEQKIRAISPNAKVHVSIAPLLSHLIEEGLSKRPETSRIIKKYVHALKVRQIDTLILGDSHYPVFGSLIAQKSGKRVKVINPSFALAAELKTFLSAHTELAEKLPKNGNSRFLVSDLTEHVQKAAKLIFGRNIVLDIRR